MRCAMRVIGIYTRHASTAISIHDSKPFYSIQWTLRWPHGETTAAAVWRMIRGSRNEDENVKVSSVFSHKNRSLALFFVVGALVSDAIPNIKKKVFRGRGGWENAMSEGLTTSTMSRHLIFVFQWTASDAFEFHFHFVCTPQLHLTLTIVVCNAMPTPKRIRELIYFCRRTRAPSKQISILFMSVRCDETWNTIFLSFFHSFVRNEPDD